MDMNLLINKAPDSYLRRGIERSYDVHAGLVDSASCIANLALKCIVVNLLKQHKHLIFLLERTIKVFTESTF